MAPGWRDVGGCGSYAPGISRAAGCGSSRWKLMTTLTFVKAAMGTDGWRENARRSGLRTRCPSNLRGSEHSRCSVVHSRARIQAFAEGRGVTFPVQNGSIKISVLSRTGKEAVVAMLGSSASSCTISWSAGANRLALSAPLANRGPQLVRLFLELAHPLRLHREIATDFFDLTFDSSRQFGTSE